MTGPDHPVVDPTRCAWQADLRDDPMTGTAPPAARLLLVEQPGPWGPRGLVDSHADPGVAGRIDRLAAAAGMRLQAIRRPGRHVDEQTGHQVAVVDTRRGARTTRWWRVETLDALARDLESATTSDDAWIPEASVVDRDPLLLVCTHGRHDACCALRGRPLVAELDRLRPGRVWETTHVGGDRFAANLLVLPTGELYGRVGPEAAASLVERIDDGHVVPELLRGWLGLTPIAQAALVFAHERLGTQRGTLAVVRVDKDDEQNARVTVRTPDGPVVVRMAMAFSAPAQLTCRGPASARARTYRGLSIGPASDETEASPTRV